MVDKVNYGLDNVPLNERIRLAEREFERIAMLKVDPSPEGDNAVFTRFGLTLENGGLDAFINHQKERIVNAKARLFEIRSQRNKLELNK